MRWAVLAWAGLLPSTLVTLRPAPRALAVLVVVWLGGCGFLALAGRRERKRPVLAELVTTRAGKAALAGFLLVTVASALLSGVAAAGVILVAGCAFLFLWAISASGEVLARRLARLLGVVVGLGVALVALEVGVRYKTRGKPLSYDPSTWPHPVTRNRYGFREREFVTPKPPGTYRIMVVGDSLTFGTGLAAEARYSELLESSLRARFPEARLEVLNFGVPGSSTVKERDLVARFADLVQPDLIVVGFCINDPQPLGMNHADELERYRVVFDAIGLLRTLKLRRAAAFLHLKTDQALRSAGLVPRWWDALDRAYREESAEWQAFVAALRDIKAVCDSRDLPPPILALLLYGSGDFNAPNEILGCYLRWCAQAGRAGREAGFLTVDVAPEFRAQGDRDRRVNPWDAHPSAECNRIYAQKIERTVLEVLAAPSLRSRPSGRTSARVPSHD